MKQILAFVLFVVAYAVSLPTGEARGMGWISADLRAEAFARIAVEQAEAGDTAGAMESIALALEAAREIGEPSTALAHVAWAQAKVGDLKGALETADRLSTGENKSYRIVALARIALDLDSRGRKAESGQVLGRMRDALEDIPGENGSIALVGAAWLLAELGDVSGGLDAAESIADTDLRAAALMAVAEVQARAGDRDAVRRGLSQALAEVTPASGEAEPGFVIPAALILAEAGDLHGAVGMANGLASLENRAFTLAGVAAFAAGAGDAAKAEVEAVAGQALALWDRRASMGLDAARVQGVSVDRVKPGGAAARAGLKAGDTILRFNGAEVSSPSRLVELVEETTVGTTVPVDFLRGGAQRTVNVTLDERGSMGIKGSWYAYDTYGEGVYVLVIEPGGAAERAGLKTGDTILRFDGAKVLNPNQFADLLDDTAAGAGVPVDFRRGGAQRTVNVILGERASMVIQATRYAFEEGASVSALEPGGAAARAGLKAGDTILRFNGVEILYLSQFTDLIDKTAAGTTVSVDFRRGDEQRTADVTLDRRPDDPDRFEIDLVSLKILSAVALAGAGDPGAALELAEALPSADHRAPVLAALAVYLSVAGDAETARAAARRAMEEAQNVSEPKLRWMAIGSATAALAEVGDLAGARAAFRRAGDHYEGAIWSPLMASARLLAGDARGAADTIISITSWWCFLCSQGPRELIEMAVLQARAGQPADAAATAKRIANGSDRIESLREIAMVLARAGDFEGARAVAGEIAYDQARKSAWADIGAIESGREPTSQPEPARYPSVAQAQALTNP
ncbi:MAG: PDZ domain-containing protein, partial [Alphaproteobacteria bacterium]